jgi:myo-inositol-1(or 4)-monophosphatase
MARAASKKQPAAPSGWDRARITEILLEAGRRAVSLRKDLRVEVKSDSSLVTAADKEIEALFAAEFDHPERGSYVIGEETISQKGEDYIAEALKARAYIVDPIDGTSPFAHHLPNWGISIGLLAGGILTDGAVYLPDYRLMVASDGPRVVEGTREEGSVRWSFRDLATPPVEKGPGGIIVMTQDSIKRYPLEVKNPVQALGAAVVPMVEILEGRMLAYVGSLRLWDLAGSLPLLHRLNFLVSRLTAEPGNRLGLAVGPEGYLLDRGDSFRWGVRGGVLVCPPSEEDWIRKAIKY